MAHPFATTLRLEDLTPDYLRTQYFSGLKICDDRGQDMPDAWFIRQLNTSIAKIEELTGVDILTRNNKSERHDYYVQDYLAYAFMRLHRMPTQSVQQVRMVYPTGQSIQVFPSEWVRIDKEYSQINLVATAGTFASMLLGQGSEIAPYLFNGSSYIPHTWEVDYVSGLDPNAIPLMVIDAICKMAVVDILTVMSDTVHPLGVTSGSLSIDGMSQSRSFNVPAFKARIDSYKAELGLPDMPNQPIAGTLSQIRNSYVGIMLASM